MEISLKKSMQELLWLCLTHGISFILLTQLSIPEKVQWALLLIVFIAMIVAIRSWVFSSGKTLSARDGKWFVGEYSSNNEARWKTKELQTVDVIGWQNFGRLLIIKCRGQQSLVLFPDAMDRASYSQLIQQLRFQKR